MNLGKANTEEMLLQKKEEGIVMRGSQSSSLQCDTYQDEIGIWQTELGRGAL